MAFLGWFAMSVRLSRFSSRSLKPLIACLPLIAMLFAPLAPAQGQDRATGTPAAKTTATEPAESAALPRQVLRPEWMQQLLLAEIALRRGQGSVGLSLYRELAEATRDPRLARRAMEIALHLHQPEAALAMARLWRALEPEAPQSRQAMIMLLSMTQRHDELAEFLSAALAAEGDNIDAALIHLPRIFARQRDREAVRALIDKVTEPYLERGQAHYARALTAWQSGDAAAARISVDRALELASNLEPAALLRAELTQPPFAAIDDLRAFVRDHPAASEARLLLARLLVSEKRYDQARREFSALLDKASDNAEMLNAVALLSLQLKDYAAAEKHFRRLMALDSDEANRARLYLGQIAEETQRPDEALAWYGQIGAGSQYLPARLRMASLLKQQGKLDEARALLRDSSAASRDERAQLIVGEAQMLRDAKRLTEAMAVLQAGLSDFPDHPELLYDTALLAERLGNLELLEKHLRRLIELKPDHAHAYNALGYSLADRNLRLDEARALIEKALELAPDDAFILDSKGWLLYRTGDLPGALAVLQDAYQKRNDPEIAAHLGEVLWKLNRRDEAKKLWAEAAKAHPDNEVLVETRRRLGEL